MAGDDLNIDPGAVHNLQITLELLSSRPFKHE